MVPEALVDLLRHLRGGDLVHIVSLGVATLHDLLAVFFYKVWQRSQQARLHEINERPQVFEFVFDRCTGQDQLVTTLQQHRRLVHLCVAVLDLLSLVQHYLIEGRFHELSHIVSDLLI